MTEVRLMTPRGPLFGSVRPPGSKSIANRALLCAALAHGRSTLHWLSDGEDVRCMAAALTALGVDCLIDWETGCGQVVGCGGCFPCSEAELDIRNSGTTARFLTAVLAAGRGRYRLHGTKRMHERPIGGLADALQQLGGQILTESPGRCPPVRIEARGLRGGSIAMSADVSSQFLSAVMLAGPCARGDLEIRWEGAAVSRPYLEMTRAVMEHFGAEAEVDARRAWVRGGTGYHAADLTIEPDASSASYFWGAAAVTGGSVNVVGIGPDSLQGDVRFVDWLEALGCRVERRSDAIRVTGPARRGVTCDLGDLSDTAPTLAVVALFVEGPTTLQKIAHVRRKESDRIGDLARELRKLGAHVTEHRDGLTITPGPLRGGELETYYDHRLAMSLSLAGLKIPGVSIVNPRCVEKTYPRFFAAIDQLAIRP